MALRNQPYLPLYVQDYLTDEKLNMCSLATQGVYIKIMCIFHKSETYGGILLKQKDKQTENICLNFAYKFAKLLPVNLPEIESAINELLDENVLQIEGDFLFQKRMIKDGKLSEIRASVGKKGGKKTQQSIKNFAKAKSEANTEDEIEYEYEDKYPILNKVEFPENLEEVIKTWLKYKSEKKQSYKEQGLKTFIKKLTEFSGGDPEMANQIIEQSMANNWAGIFELKTKSNETTWNDTKGGFYSDTTRRTIEAVKRGIEQCG